LRIELKSDNDHPCLEYLKYPINKNKFNHNIRIKNKELGEANKYGN